MDLIGIFSGALRQVRDQTSSLFGMLFPPGSAAGMPAMEEPARQGFAKVSRASRLTGLGFRLYWRAKAAGVVQRRLG
jgi:hypothetical protein